MNTATDSSGETPPALTAFEEQLHNYIDEIFDKGGAGYQWNKIDDLIEEELDLSVRVKRATSGSRAANVLKESPQKRPDFYLVVIGPEYSTERFRPIAIRDLTNNPGSCDAVAVAEKVDGTWRIRQALGTRPGRTVEVLEATFPMVEKVLIVGEGVAFEPVKRIVPSPESLIQLREDFSDFVAARRVHLHASVLTDILACALSAQFVLFAGPSGTGKSTVARLLGEFFTHPQLFSVIEARRQWIGPEDAAGYYSTLARRFVATPSTGELVSLSTESADQDPAEEAAPPTPILLIEESNLSPMEGYAAPLIHGLSRPSAIQVIWELYPADIIDAGAGDETAPPEQVLPPPRVTLAPYPRLLGTINVDATAPAPARKVSGRAAVVLLEPLAAVDAATVASMAEALGEEGPDLEPAGLPHMQNPAAALEVLDEGDRSSLAEALLDFAQTVFPESARLASQRDLVRSLLYMAYFKLLCADQGDQESMTRLAAENAWMHFVLPTLEAQAFEAAIDRLTSVDLTPVGDVDKIGGLLVSRVEWIARQIEESGGLTGLVDFWSALS